MELLRLEERCASVCMHGNRGRCGAKWLVDFLVEQQCHVVVCMTCMWDSMHGNRGRRRTNDLVHKNMAMHKNSAMHGHVVVHSMTCASVCMHGNPGRRGANDLVEQQQCHVVVHVMVQYDLHVGMHAWRQGRRGTYNLVQQRQRHGRVYDLRVGLPACMAKGS